MCPSKAAPGLNARQVAPGTRDSGKLHSKHYEGLPSKRRVAACGHGHISPYTQL